MLDTIDTIDAIVVGEFLANYLKYPPVGRAGAGDPHCIGCGLTTLELDDEFDMVSYHVFRCRACQRAIRERESAALPPSEPTPSPGWDPNAPLSATNHPPCEACDEGIDGVPCTCLGWEGYDDTCADTEAGPDIMLTGGPRDGI